MTQQVCRLQIKSRDRKYLDTDFYSDAANGETDIIFCSGCVRDTYSLLKNNGLEDHEYYLLTLRLYS